MGISDLYLDQAVRDWVFIPLTLSILLMKLMTQFAHQVGWRSPQLPLSAPTHFTGRLPLAAAEQPSPSHLQQGAKGNSGAASCDTLTTPAWAVSLHPRDVIQDEEGVLHRKG